MPWYALSPFVSYRRVRSLDQSVVHLAGELDLGSVEPLRRVVGEEMAGVGAVVLDLSRLSFVDGRGIAALLELRHLAARQGQRFSIRRPHRMVRRVVHLLELTQALSLEAPVSHGAPAGVVAILEEALEGAVRIADAQRANAQIVDETGALRIVAQRGFAPAFLDFFEVVDGDESACAVALRSGRPAWVHDVQSSAVFDGTPARAVVLDAGARAVASLPVAVTGSTVGVISVHREEAAPWSATLRQRLVDHADLAAHALAPELVAG